MLTTTQEVIEPTADNMVVSFTSHARRLPFIDRAFRGHVALAEATGAHVCVSLQDDVADKMTTCQKELVSSGRIELLTIPKDYGSNTKWPLARKRYPNKWLIVVDDDRLYPVSMVKDLVKFATNYPRAVGCRAYRMLAPPAAPGAPLSYRLDGRRGTPPLKTCRHLHGPKKLDTRRVIIEHWAGVLYPPGFPDPEFANEAVKIAPFDDDTFFTTLVTRGGIDAYVVPTSDDMIYTKDLALADSRIRACALGRVNQRGRWKRTRQALANLREFFF